MGRRTSWRLRREACWRMIRADGLQLSEAEFAGKPAAVQSFVAIYYLSET